MAGIDERMNESEKTEGPTTEKARFCLKDERAKGKWNTLFS